MTNLKPFPPIIVAAYRPNYFYETRCGDVYSSDSEFELLTNTNGDLNLISRLVELSREAQLNKEQYDWEFSVVIDGLTDAHEDYPFWVKDDLLNLVLAGVSAKKEEAKELAERDEQRKRDAEAERQASLKLKAENEEKALYLTLKSKYHGSL